MSVRIAWAPSPDNDIASYEIQKSLAGTGPWLVLVLIPHNLTGPNYDSAQGQFFYVDSSGGSTDLYRLTAIDQEDNRSTTSSPFQPVVAPPAIPAGVSVDHNYPTPGNLRYQTLSGVPIQGATVRVYRKADFDQGLTDSPLAATTTNAQGNWSSPIVLTTGYTYTVHFSKESQYGPDVTEIIV